MREPGFDRGSLPARFFVDPSGRLRSGWRAGIFVAIVVLAVIALSELLALTGLVSRGGDSLWVGLIVVLPAALFASWVTVERLERLPLSALGLPGGSAAVGGFARGTGLGVLIMAATIGLLAAAGWVSWSDAPGGIGPYLVSAALLCVVLAGAAFTEELLFRGYPLQVLAEGSGGAVAIGITSVAFGLLHAGNPNVGPLPLINIALAGVLLGLAYWRTYSLWFASGVHFGWNWTMGAFGLSVSGLDLELAGLEATLRGPAIWTGGSFGPEGGLVTTLVTLIGIAWISRTPRLRRNLEVLALAPLPERRPGGGGGGGA